MARLDYPMRFSARTTIVIACLAGCAMQKISRIGDDDRPSVTQDDVPPAVEGPDRLLGDLAGLRPSLDSVGLTFEIDYTFETMRVVDGGIRRTADLLGNLDVQLAADLEKTVGLPGARALIYGIANHGGNPSEAIGDFQVASNIESPEGVRLHEAWFEQSAMEGRVSGRVGIYDINTEFDVIPAGGLFIHSSHGMGGDIGNSGRNGPSTFPATSLAAKVEAHPTDGSFVRAVVADGVPGDPQALRRTSVRFDDGDGILLIGEVGTWTPGSWLAGDRGAGKSGKVAVGVWRYTGDFDDFLRVDGSGNPEQRSGGGGAYALIQQPLFHESEDRDEGLVGFLRAGLADGRVFTIDQYLGVGLVYQGLFHGRGQDELGLAVATGRFGSDFQRASGGASGWEDWEIAFELTYRAEVTPWWWVQPDVQYVVHPGGDPAIDDALVLGLRTMVSF